MEPSLLDLIHQIKDKCIENDCNACEQFGLTPAELNFFRSIQDLSRLEISIITTKMNLSQSRLSRVIDKLVKKGFIERKDNPKDRRAIKISLTAKGRKTRNQIIDYKSTCEKKIELGLKSDDVSSIKEALNLLLNSL